MMREFQEEIEGTRRRICKKAKKGERKLTTV
jgi:hypothetical protein